LPRKPPKANEYRRLAQEAAASAQASGLDHVREIHEKAAIRWAALAVREDRLHDAEPAR
jgi:hypothetical protein